MGAHSEPKIYRPTGESLPIFLFALGGGIAYAYLMTATVDTYFWRGVVIGGVIMVAFAFLGGREWVYLYDDRLEIRRYLVKLIEDQLGVTLLKPRVIHFRHIIRLQQTFALPFWGRYLVITLPAERWGERNYSIHRDRVENYQDLEADLLRRVPPGCQLDPKSFPQGHGPKR